jgi:hypothetical protein
MKQLISPSVVDLITEADSKKRQTVEERIERRLDVLREWLRDGIPAGKIVPKSLNAARTWNDPEIGIMPIASPNEFTSTHNLHGNLVRDVAGLLTALKKRLDKPQYTVKSPSIASASKFDRKSFDRQLEVAVSQWHAERDQHLQEKRRADAAEARNIVLLDENKRKDEVIADLRRQLAKHARLRVVK